MGDLERIYDRLLDQYTDVPNWQKYYKVFCELTDELRQAIIEWMAGNFLETAEGVWLDRCGDILGLPRPAEWLDEGVFTWDSDVFDERWDQGVWSDGNGILTGDLVDDDLYRPLLRAKAISLFADGTLYDIARVLEVGIGKTFTVETSAPRVVTATFTETLTEFEQYYAQTLAPTQADTDFVLAFDIT
jgi:hypothetical protein